MQTSKMQPRRRARLGQLGAAVLAGAISLLSSDAMARPAKTTKAAKSAKTAKSSAEISDRLPFTRAAAGPEPVKQGGVGMVLDGTQVGVSIRRVVPGGPAARAGVLAGDVILSVDGHKLTEKPVVSQVAGRIRGPIGSICRLVVRRKGVAAPVGLNITRGSMAALFPQLSSAVVAVRPDTALLASGPHLSLGVRFVRSGAANVPVEYEWAIGPIGGQLRGTGSRTGTGVVRWSKLGATIQIDTWRLELAPWPDHDAMLVQASNLAIALVSGDRWRTEDPVRLTYVRPRSAPKPSRKTWEGGACAVRLSATLDGRPAAGRRLTLWLASDKGAGLPTASTLTDADGRTTLRLPVGSYRVTNLYASINGGARDLYFDAVIDGPMPQLVCSSANAELSLALALKTSHKPPHPVALSLPDSARKHALIGRSMPTLTVRKWHGETATLPATLKGRAMLVYVWATWCGPCKRVSPIVAELHARLASKGLLVVSASVDRDGAALQDYAAGQLAGAAPMAWLGPTAMAQLSISGIPTVFAVDAKGVVRAVHTGTGVGLKAWTAEIDKLLAGAR